ncbi:MAG TPA: hypothetical protein PLJ35_03550 [Anaerolineae bacterium]|nr:hypothetical protein [Anaerolineae bacterium]HOQ97877.1 hypothetical protein [Anaerolineae bacterium]HPL26694.1 hypothetical protein [Anaerolineae bacterium]
MMDTATHSQTIVALPLHEHLARWTATWWDEAAAQPTWGRAYTPAEQRACEEQLEHLLRATAAELQRAPRDEAERRAARARLMAAAAPLAGALLGVEAHTLDALAATGLADAAAEFVREARRFDPALTAEDIYQASRNVWTMNAMQLVLGRPVRLTPAILAYSLLYPYTDNYLDDPAITAAEKAAFGERFGRRLAGEALQPRGAIEALIDSLVAMIEGQFPRAAHPEVYAALLAIHRAQAESVALLGRGQVDVLALTFAKGGASVVADGYLVAGTLTTAQVDFLYGYGALTQLIDDLEDVEQDRRAGLATVFSSLAGRAPLDGVTTRTLYLAAQMLRCMAAASAKSAAPLCDLMQRAIGPTLAATAGRARRLHSPSFRRALEAHAPCRCAFMEKVQRRLQGARWLEALLDLA